MELGSFADRAVLSFVHMSLVVLVLTPGSSFPRIRRRRRGCPVSCQRILAVRFRERSWLLRVESGS